MLEALERARAIVIGPSNPVISIGPILAVGGVADALRATEAPVVAVSPLVRGEVLKGPTDLFMDWAGHPLSADGICAHYEGLIDGLVSDERASESRRSRPTSRWATPRPGAAWRARRWTSPPPCAGSLRRAVRTLAVLPVKSFGRAKQRLGEAVGADDARGWRARWPATCSRRWAASRGSTA